MDSFFKEIDKLIIESNEKINEKILGINYLEKLKFSLIKRIIDLNINPYDEIKNFEEVKEYNNIKLIIKSLELKKMSKIQSTKKIYSIKSLCKCA